MDYRRALAVAVLAVSLAVSGCQAPGASVDAPGPSEQKPAGQDGLGTNTTQNETTGEAGDPFPVSEWANVTVEGGELRTDPGLVYERLRILLETETPAPESVRVYNSTEEFGDSLPTGGIGTDRPRFFDVIGFESGAVGNETFVDRVGNGYTLGSGSVALFVQPNATREEETMLVAHELAHYIQFQNDRQRRLAEQIDPQTGEGSYVIRALTEGAAVFTTDEYLRKFGENETLNSPYYDDEQEAYPAGHIRRWSNSQYRIGSEYVATRIESPSEVATIFEDPPTRSRALLDPDAGPRPPLAVTLHHDRNRISKNRLGATFLRFGLESHIDPSRARAVAEGFGSDSLYQFRSDPDVFGNYVWAMRFEGESAADRFDGAIRDYLDARGNRTAGGWRLPDLGVTVELRRPSTDTRTLVIGSPSFVDETVTTGRDGAVSIESDGQ
jgi:hypothetical protein